MLVLQDALRLRSRVCPVPNYANSGTSRRRFRQVRTRPFSVNSALDIQCLAVTGEKDVVTMASGIGHQSAEQMQTGAAAGWSFWACCKRCKHASMPATRAGHFCSLGQERCCKHVQVTSCCRARSKYSLTKSVGNCFLPSRGV